MSRVIGVTAGQSDFAVVRVTDTLGHDLTSVGFQMGLSTDRDTLPATWYAATVFDSDAAGVWVRLLIDSTKAPPDLYWVWLKVPDSPTLQIMRLDRTLRTV